MSTMMKARRSMPQSLVLPMTAVALVLAFSSAAQAQTGAVEQRAAPHSAPHRAAGAADDIVVAGHPPIDYALLAGTTTLEGDKLIAASRGQIGETLARLPGVSATSFSPGASRPVLRGMDGDRIRVLVDGIGSVDAASVSADHAVVLDTLTTDHIDVIHGPAVLMFGGQAIGGAINVLDKRIPRSVPDHIHGEGIAGYATAARERSLAGAFQVPLGERLAASVDASWRKSDDLRVGGLIHSRSLRSELLEEAEHLREDGETAEADEFEELAGLSGKVPNTGTRSLTLGAGIAFLDAGGNLGISVQRHDTRYGVPLRPGTSHGHGDEDEHGGEEEHHGDAPVSIDLVQTRIDLRGAVELGGFFDVAQFRGAYGDYRHIEFEGDEEGTRFAARGLEVRGDLVQSDSGGWRGRSGVQYHARRMTVVGAEAFVPGNDVSRFGVFTIQSVKLGLLELEAAGRFERATVKTIDNSFSRDFNLWSGAAGFSFKPAEAWNFGANYIRGARPPAPEELLADGLHVATQAYEQGDPGFAAETSDGFEAYIRYRGERARISLTAYLTDFDGFISASPTGEDREDFPVFSYVQGNARFKGIEAAASWDALKWGGGAISFDVSADYTRAQIAGVGPAPRIPPLRVRAGTDLQLGDLRLRAEAEWNDRQTRVANFENPVAAYTFVNLSADWHPGGDDGPLTLIASANNLFDVVGRRAASFTREFVPLAGRDIRVSARVSF